MTDDVPTVPEAFAARVAALEARVSEAAAALEERGLRPTVARVRAALGGGSPNDLAPALKAWRESGRTASSADPGSSVEGFIGLPPALADLAQELWQRARAAALLEVRSGATPRALAARSAEAQGLRDQLTATRDALEREALAYGELRVQGARHEALARAALLRADAAEQRERRALRELGAARARLAELQAALDQARASIPKGGVSPRRQRSPSAPRVTPKATASRPRSKSPVNAKSRKPPPPPRQSNRTRSARARSQPRSTPRRR
jgi:hypothetical protein